MSKKKIVNALRDIVEEDFGLSWQPMCKFLLDHGAALAGSSVMKAVAVAHDALRGKWEGMDLDVWVPHVRNKKQYDIMYNMIVNIGGFGSFPKTFGKSRNADVEPGAVVDIEQEYTRLAGYVDKMWSLQTRDGKTVQIIFLQPDVGVANTVATFDLIAAQVYFDGKTVLTPPETVKVKRTRNWVIIEEKEDDGSTAVVLEHQAKPVVEWETMRTHADTAFQDIVNGATSLSAVATRLQSPYEWIRTIRRIIKYASRGIFIFPNDPSWDLVRTSLQKIMDSGLLFDWDNFKDKWNKTAHMSIFWSIPEMRIQTSTTGGVSTVVLDETVQCREVKEIRDYVATSPLHFVVFNQSLSAYVKMECVHTVIIIVMHICKMAITHPCLTKVVREVQDVVRRLYHVPEEATQLLDETLKKLKSKPSKSFDKYCANAGSFYIKHIGDVDCVDFLKIMHACLHKKVQVCCVSLTQFI